MDASTLLKQARDARRSGDKDTCVNLASAAMSAAEQEKDAETAYHAPTCVGRLLLSRGEANDSLGWFRMALDAALKGGLVAWLGPAYHEMYLASREAGCSDARKRWGATAFTLYRDVNPKHPGVTGLLADFALEVMEQHPECRDSAAHCVQAWRAVPASMTQSRFHLAAAANVMGAAAALGIRSRYDNAVQDLETAYVGLPHHEHTARTLCHAAEAATRMRDYERGHELAKRSVSIASTRREEGLREQAESVRDAAWAEKVARL